jgi:hypothetical protein
MASLDCQANRRSLGAWVNYSAGPDSGCGGQPFSALDARMTLTHDENDEGHKHGAIHAAFLDRGWQTSKR